MATSASHSPLPSQVGVYECEVTLKFRLIEESQVIDQQDHLLELLIDAFSYGSDEFVEALESQVKVQVIDEVNASPLMRRQLIRLRNLPSA
ncbi:Npun_R1517 family heterocyst differentiation transcriptional regulator [Leptolyngbya sp. BL0902]|uniref:Npun_R1517 family heterocyst differentiation transcriptional regulator n=1 Tax=Leptolyngbya sp. BL0902 TaxID=1115757 RepID=UPI0018E7E559|nr:Npun_R1517 family heterocyst differentiation transcriptional regulator [Leptolyngbya sp. BL0902]